MGNLSILMLIKEHSNQNTFTIVKFFYFTIFTKKKKVLKNFGKVKIIKSPAGFELMIYRFVGNALTTVLTLLGNISEKIYGCPIPPLYHYTSIFPSSLYKFLIPYYTAFHPKFFIFFIL